MVYYNNYDLGELIWKIFLSYKIDIDDVFIGKICAQGHHFVNVYRSVK